MLFARRQVQLTRFLLQGGCNRSLHALPADRVYTQLEERGIVVRQDESRAALIQHLQGSKSKGLYLGIDPTASSLHVGHLLPLMVLLHFHTAGHRVFPLIGGATGLVGDPTGRQTARDPAYLDKVHTNTESLAHQLDYFFTSASKYARRRIKDAVDLPNPVIFDNAMWHRDMKLLDFLRDVGSFAKLQTMLARESVRTRMASATGLPFSEFTYQLLQAYDFYKLHQEHDCTLQIGGSDQWGNILAGIELISRKLSADPERSPAFGILTALLLSSSNGEKLGKSAGNAVWLDSSRTSIFDFYQYFMRVEDVVTGHMLRYFTFLSLEEIEGIVEEHEGNPEKRLAQKKLAQEVTELIHGEQAVARAEAATDALFGTSLSQMRTVDLLSVLEEGRQAFLLPAEELIGKSVVQLAAKHGLTSSVSEAKQTASNGGLYLNGQSIAKNKQIAASDLLDDRFTILRAGKAKHVVLALKEEDR